MSDGHDFILPSGSGGKMVRNYKRKTEDRWTKEDLLNALMCIKNNELKINDAARTFGISRATLYRQYAKFMQGGAKCDVNQFRTCGGNPILTKVEEDVLEKTITDLRAQGFTVGSTDIKRICFEYCDSNGIPNQFNAEKRTASDDWYYGFLKRHPSVGRVKSNTNADGTPDELVLKPKVKRRSVKAKGEGAGKRVSKMKTEASPAKRRAKASVTATATIVKEEIPEEKEDSEEMEQNHIEDEGVESEEDSMKAEVDGEEVNKADDEDADNEDDEEEEEEDEEEENEEENVEVNDNDAESEKIDEQDATQDMDEDEGENDEDENEDENEVGEDEENEVTEGEENEAEQMMDEDDEATQKIDEHELEEALKSDNAEEDPLAVEAEAEEAEEEEEAAEPEEEEEEEEAEPEVENEVEDVVQEEPKRKLNRKSKTQKVDEIKEQKRVTPTRSRKRPARYESLSRSSTPTLPTPKGRGRKSAPVTENERSYVETSAKRRRSRKNFA